MENGADQKKYDYLRENSSQIVDRVEQLATTYDKMLQEGGMSLGKSIKALETSPFEQARAKVKSQLINIAICGAFSSGKSFLVNALMDRITWFSQEATAQDIFTGQDVDRYITLLPTSAQQTNSCPLAILPGAPEDRYRFQVMFADTQTWEDRSDPSMSDEEISRRILAYATDVEEGRIARTLEDQPRTVLRARLFVGEMPLPAVIYDLPGIGGIGEAYLQTVHDALRRADCIVYVASAIKELTDAEFGLLRFVEEIAEQEETRVFFVLTQIDREPEWTKILEKDNQFLRDCFTRDGKPRLDLIGQGFVPISAAAEAKAKGLYDSSRITLAERDLAIEKSGAPSFREMLHEHLTTQSGPAHLREVITEMYGILKDVRAHIQNRNQAEALPLQDAERRIQESKTLIKTLGEKSKALADDLGTLAESTLNTAMACSNPDDLLAQLKGRVAPLINQADVTKDAEIDIIHQAIKNTRDDWLQRPEAGFTVRWAQGWENYQKQALAFLRERVSQAVEEAAVTFPIILGDEFAPEVEDSVIRVKEKLQGVTVARGISLGVTTLGVGSIAAGAFALGGATLAVAPVGVFLIGAGAAGLGWSMLKKRRDLKRLRSPLLDYLPKYSNRVVTQLNTQAKDILAMQKGELLTIVEQLISVQKDNITALENRLKTGDLKIHQDQVRLLNVLEHECKEIEQLIQNPNLWAKSQ